MAHAEDPDRVVSLKEKIKYIINRKIEKNWKNKTMHEQYYEVLKNW